MKQVRFTSQFNVAFTLTFVVVLASVNYIFYKAQERAHNNQQDKLCELIIASFTPSLEYGLTYGNKSDLELTLLPLRNNPDIAYIRVVDNQQTVMAQVDNRGLVGIAQNIAIETFDSDIIQSMSGSFSSSFPDQQIEGAEIPDRRLGKVQIATTPFRFSRYNDNLARIALNAALLIPLLLFWLYLKFRQGHQRKIVKKLINILNNTENYNEVRDTLKTTEGSELLTAVQHQVIRAQSLRHQLNLLKTEVQQARLDANTELHEFIGFITQQEFKNSASNLMLFYQAIKQPVDKDKKAIWCRDVITQTLTDLSSLASEERTLIQDSFSGNRMSYQVHIDEASFKKMLRLIIQQLILICKNETLSIHFDLRQDYRDNATLRISFSSNASGFTEGLREQSLFQFKENLPVSIHSNNIQLISAKHLLRKFGGEYFYFSDEVRLEMPLNTLNSTENKTQPESIQALGISLSTLVYDSDPIDKMVLIGYLTKLGLDVDKATTKQVVLQKIRHDNYDVILVNSDFIAEDPSFDFENFLEELEQLEHQPHVIIVSRNNTIIESKAFQKLKKAKFLPKPVAPKKLGAILSSL